VRRRAKTKQLVSVNRTHKFKFKFKYSQ
jgi:hypothetical protein